MIILPSARIVIEAVKVPTGTTDGTVVVLEVGTIIALVVHQLPQGVVIIVGGRTLITVNVVAGTMTRSTANDHVLQRHSEDTDTNHIGVGARVLMGVPAREVTTSTYLAATEMTCPTFKFF